MALLMLGGFVLLGYFTYQIADFLLRDTYTKTITLTFSNFISLYEANPDEWELFSREAKYGKFFVVFPFISFYRYKIWFNRKEKQVAKRQKLKDLEDFTKSYRNDLKKKQEEEERRIEARIREQLNKQVNLTVAPEPEDTREKVIIKYTGKLPE